MIKLNIVLMKLLLAITVFLSIVTGCADSSGNSANENNQDSAVAKNYYPVKDLIRNEIAKADSFFTTFKKYTIQNNKTDSSIIQPEEFRQLASEFATDELSKEALEKEYSEASFLDQTTGFYTFTYSTTNTSLAFQRVDVLATSGDGFDKINSYYLEKISAQGDTLIKKKVYWKAGKSFQVITETTINNQSPQTGQYKVVWNELE